MNGLFWLLALFALAVALAFGLELSDGYVLLVWPPYRMEITLNLALAGLLLGFVLLHLTLRAVAMTLSLPRRVAAYRQARQQQQGRALFDEALRLLFEGRFTQALKKAGDAYRTGQSPGLAALLAARAAQRLREPDKQRHWLELATSSGGEACLPARLMLEAEWQLEAGDYSAAVATLNRLQERSGRHIAAQRLLLRAQQGRGQWDEVLRLTRQLEKRGALLPAQASELCTKARREQLRLASNDVGLLRAAYAAIPAAEIQESQVVIAAEALLKLGAEAEAERLLVTALNRQWSSVLVGLYGRCRGGDIGGRLAQAERWLREHPDDARLLVALGHSCVELRLWGKAQSYFDASLSLAPSREAYEALIHLSQVLGREDAAQRYARLMSQPAPAAEA